MYGFLGGNCMMGGEDVVNRQDWLKLQKGGTLEDCHCSHISKQMKI